MMMEEKTLATFQHQVMCERKKINYGEKFFHSHNGYELFILLDGSVNYYVESEGQTLIPGNVLCIKPYSFHRKEGGPEDPLDRIIISIREDLMDSLSSVDVDLSACFYTSAISYLNVTHLNDNELHQIVEYATLLEDILTKDAYAKSLLIEIYLKQILIIINQHFLENGLVSQKNIMPPLVKHTISYIEEHISEEIHLQDLSQHFHHNGTYISRSFKKITGISLQNYILGKKITLEKKYLR